MFTLNANLIEQAALSGNPKDLSQALANCAAPLRHRGPIQNAMGSAGYPYGGFPGAHQAPEGIAGGGPQVDLKFINIEIPPWQNIPFTPTPLLDVPPWPGFDFPPQWPGGAGGAVGDPRNELRSPGSGAGSGSRPADSGGRAPAAGPSLNVEGDVRLGDTIINNLTTQNITSENVTNNQNITNRGDFSTAGDVTILGDTVHGGPVTHSAAVTNQGPVTTFGSVDNRFTTNNQTVNNYGQQHSVSEVNNYGPVSSYSTVNNYGPTNFRTNAYFNQDVYNNATVYNGGDTYTFGDTYTYGDVEHNLDTGDSFVINDNTTTLVNVSTTNYSWPSTPSTTHNTNFFTDVHIGGDTYTHNSVEHNLYAGDSFVINDNTTTLANVSTTNYSWPSTPSTTHNTNFFTDVFIGGDTYTHNSVEHNLYSGDTFVINEGANNILNVNTSISSTSTSISNTHWLNILMNMYFGGDTYFRQNRIFVFVNGQWEQLDVALEWVVSNVTWSGTKLQVERKQVRILRQVVQAAATTDVLNSVSKSVLTDVTWSGSTLSKAFSSIRFLGTDGSSGAGTILTAAACPDAPLDASSSNWSDIP